MQPLAESQANTPQLACIRELLLASPARILGSSFLHLAWGGSRQQPSAQTSGTAIGGGLRFRR